MNLLVTISSFPLRFLLTPSHSPLLLLNTFCMFFLFIIHGFRSLIVILRPGHSINVLKKLSGVIEFILNLLSPLTWISTTLFSNLLKIMCDFLLNCLNLPFWTRCVDLLPFKLDVSVFVANARCWNSTWRSCIIVLSPSAFVMFSYHAPDWRFVLFHFIYSFDYYYFFLLIYSNNQCN